MWKSFRISPFTIFPALVQLNGNRIKIKWLSKYTKRLITVCFQTVYGLIFLKNPIELNQCHLSTYYHISSVISPCIMESQEERRMGTPPVMMQTPFRQRDKFSRYYISFRGLFAGDFSIISLNFSSVSVNAFNSSVWAAGMELSPLSSRASMINVGVNASMPRAG